MARCASQLKSIRKPKLSAAARVPRASEFGLQVWPSRHVPKILLKPPHPFPTTPTTLECAVGRRTWLARMQRLRLQPSEERARGPVCGLSLSACIMRSARGTQRSGWGPQSSAAVAERLAARLEAQAHHAQERRAEPPWGRCPFCARRGFGIERERRAVFGTGA